MLNRIDDPQEAAEELVALANVHGGRDNVTVVVVDVLAGAEPRATTAGTSIAGTSIAGTSTDGDVDADPGADEVGTEEPVSGLETVGASPAPPVEELGDPAATASTTMVLAGAAPTGARKRRRMTGRMFIVLLAAAALLTVAIVAARRQPER